jgi:hypothetical protein
MYCVIFKHADQACVYPELLAAVNQVCNYFKKNAECSAGYRTLECQKATAKIVLSNNKGSYQLEDGSVYIGTGANKKCLASAYGKSNHCYGLAMDINGWFEDLTNVQLKKYGLIKPIAYEPWHVQLTEMTWISEAKKIAVRDSYLMKVGDNMEVKEFQAMTGLVADGVSGSKTKAKAEEVLNLCQKILENDFISAEEVIKATQNAPDMWLIKLKEIKFFDAFIMNIVNKMGGAGNQ